MEILRFLDFKIGKPGDWSFIKFKQLCNNFIHQNFNVTPGYLGQDQSTIYGMID